MKVFPITGAIQNYAWGGSNFIPELIGQANPQAEPFAELWMGAHERGPSRVENTEATLSEFIAQNPINVLGQATAKHFDKRLPFLFKILDVNKMLSIQSHPTKAQAEVGFRAENEAGVPIKAKHRNFRDDNHKPEIMVALTEFWLLHGFRPKAEITIILEKVPEFVSLRPLFAKENIYTLYEAIMKMPQSEVDVLLAPLYERLQGIETPKDTPDYWAKMAFEDYTRDGHYDRGIFSIYLFNLVRLEKGDGIFQAAGVPHAYLEGVNVELMANSDNVFRGGLTPKHIDVPQLLKHLVTKSVEPKILKGEIVSESECIYRSPAPDFELARIKISTSQSHQRATNSADILIVMEGEAEVESKEGRFKRGRGQVFFASANSQYKVQTTTHATLYRASVPI